MRGVLPLVRQGKPGPSRPRPQRSEPFARHAAPVNNCGPEAEPPTRADSTTLVARCDLEAELDRILDESMRNETEYTDAITQQRATANAECRRLMQRAIVQNRTLQHAKIDVRRCRLPLIMRLFVCPEMHKMRARAFGPRSA